ncbi:MAG: hypothetical protein ACP5F3_02670 [Candidatus Syntrophosphaera sp.]
MFLLRTIAWLNVVEFSDKIFRENRGRMFPVALSKSGRDMWFSEGGGLR